MWFKVLFETITFLILMFWLILLWFFAFFHIIYAVWFHSFHFQLSWDTVFSHIFFIFSLLFFSYFHFHFSNSVGFFLVSIFQLRIVVAWVYLLLIIILGMVSCTPVNDDIMTLLIFPLCFDQDLLTAVWTVVYFWILNLSFRF